MSDQFARYVVMVDDFRQDTNGNPIARYTVFGYLSKQQEIGQPTGELFQTKQRRQIGYSGKCDEFAGRALSNAQAPDGLQLTRHEGSRAEGCVFLVYDVPGAA
jgi:hypothetical protein